MTIFDPLSAGLMMMLGFFSSCVNAWRSEGERLSSVSVRVLYFLRVIWSSLMRRVMLLWTWDVSGCQVDVPVKGVY